jgi:hypothetical protein
VASGLLRDSVERQSEELDVCNAQEGDDSSWQTGPVHSKHTEQSDGWSSIAFQDERADLVKAAFTTKVANDNRVIHPLQRMQDIAASKRHVRAGVDKTEACRAKDV